MNAIKMNAHFVLVHGFSHGGWCWYKIKSRLENLGYKVSCPDLKASGIDQADPNTVLNFKDYTKPLIDLLSSSPDDEKVILVGHSIGGFNVTDATELFGKKLIILGSIYVAANMFKPGVTPEEVINYGAPDFSKYGGVSNVYYMNYGLGQDKFPTSVLVKEEFQLELLYNMSPQEDVALASMLLRPGPNYALKDVCFTDDGEDIDKVPCIYIRTIHDQMMRVEKQENMINVAKPWKAYEIESDHSPFFSAPDALVPILVEAATSVGYDAPNS